MQAQTSMIKIEDIDVEMKAYPRQHTQSVRVQEIMAIMQSGEKIDPIVVCHIRGRDKVILVDGAHRREAHLKLGMNMVEAEDLGLLTLAEALKEGVRRNSRGPMLLTTSDMKLAAQKMLDLDVPLSEVEALTHLDRLVIKSLSNITFTSDGEKKILPRALKIKGKDGLEKPLISDSEIRQHANVIEKMQRNYSPARVMSFLSLLIDMDWLQVEDEGILREAHKLYEKLGTLFEKEKA